MKLKYSINTCRLCLESESVQSIHDKDECGLSIYDKIIECTDVQISTDTKWPDKICDMCLQTLDISYKFRTKCKHTDEVLHQLYAENEIQICEKDILVEQSSLLSKEDKLIDVLKLDELAENCIVEEVEEALEKDEVETLTASASVDLANMKQEVASNRKKRCRKKSDAKYMHICEVCGNTYQYKSALVTHMRRHTNDKPFSCEICGRRFVLNGQLTCHMRTHTGEKPYECRFCKRRYADVGARQVHERIHTGERPFKCDICKKSFTYASVLKKHQLTHTDEKKYSCENCGKQFRLRYHLTAHLNTSKHQSSNEAGENEIRLENIES